MSSRPPVVLVHGSRTSRTMWRAQLEAMARAGVRAVAVDLPGHGARRDERFTLAGSVETLAGTVSDLGEPALVIGLSLGGYVAIEHRAQHPDQVRGLVAASCSTPPATRVRDAWLLLARRIERLPDGGARLNQVVVDRSLTLQGALDIGAGGFALEVMSDILTEVGRCDPLAALAAASSPVWIVNGQWDHFRLSEGSYVAAAQRGGASARLVTVRRAKHLVNLDAPVAFNRVLLDVLASLVATDGSPGERDPSERAPAPRPGRVDGSVGGRDHRAPR